MATTPAGTWLDAHEEEINENVQEDEWLFCGPGSPDRRAEIGGHPTLEKLKVDAVDLCSPLEPLFTGAVLSEMGRGRRQEAQALSVMARIPTKGCSPHTRLSYGAPFPWHGKTTPVLGSESGEQETP